MGNFVQRHAEAVSLNCYVHVLYITALENAESNFTIEDRMESGVQITTVYYRKSSFLNGLKKIRGFFKGIQYIKKNHGFDFDVVHHNVIWKDAWQPWLLYHIYKLPYIITEHWTGFDTKTRKHSPRSLISFARLFTSKASALCPVTENLAQSMQTVGISGNYRVIPNVVDTSLFQLKDIQPTPIRFLHVSSLLDEQKNISGILRTWKKATQHIDNIHLMIGGDGSWESYQPLIQSLEIPPHTITFFHEKKWSEIAEMIEESHCLVMFSNYENLPCVIVESLACGMFIISTRVGGIAEHILPERGTLIAPQDETALLDSLIQFCQSATTIDRNALREYAVHHFSKPVIADAFTAIYEEISSGKS